MKWNDCKVCICKLSKWFLERKRRDFLNIANVIHCLKKSFLFSLIYSLHFLQVCKCDSISHNDKKWVWITFLAKSVSTTSLFLTHSLTFSLCLSLSISFLLHRLHSELNHADRLLVNLPVRSFLFNFISSNLLYFSPENKI